MNVSENHVLVTKQEFFFYEIFTIWPKVLNNSCSLDASYLRDATKQFRVTKNILPQYFRNLLAASNQNWKHKYFLVSSSFSCLWGPKKYEKQILLNFKFWCMEKPQKTWKKKMILGVHESRWDDFKKTVLKTMNQHFQTTIWFSPRT